LIVSLPLPRTCIGLAQWLITIMSSPAIAALEMQSLLKIRQLFRSESPLQVPARLG
jgi:hypothetical protein